MLQDTQQNKRGPLFRITLQGFVPDIEINVGRWSLDLIPHSPAATPFTTEKTTSSMETTRAIFMGRTALYVTKHAKKGGR